MISFLTPHLPGRRKSYLQEIYELLLQEAEPWEWLIQIDGPATGLSLPRDPRIKIEANGRNLMMAQTRNLALGRARGEWIVPLDDDDLFYPGSFWKVIREAGDYQIASGVPEFLGPDGEREEWLPLGKSLSEYIPRHGEIAKWQLVDLWEKEATLGLPGNYFFWRRETLLRLGGWSALSGAEDAALILFANTELPIYYSQHKTVICRAHDGQSSADEAILSIRKRNHRLIDQRLRLLR